MPARSVTLPARHATAGLGSLSSDVGATSGGLRGRPDWRARRAARLDMRELLERAFDVDISACRLARRAVTECLHEHVGRPALETARLLVTELVANAVSHSGAYPDESVVVRVWLGEDDVRLEVDDPGRGGVVRLKAPSFNAGGGLGLNLVDVLSERWAAEHIPGARTRVWADLGRTSDFATGPFPAIERDELMPGTPPQRRSITHETELLMTDRGERAPAAASDADTRSAGLEPHDALQERVEPHDALQDRVAPAPRRRAQTNLERAHKSVNGISEALPGAPRSGSA